MDRGNFDKAPEYYQEGAQAEAKDPAALDATIQLTGDHHLPRIMGNGQYTEVHWWRFTQNRVTDRIPRRAGHIGDCSIWQSAQPDDQFNSDLDEAQRGYLDAR